MIKDLISSTYFVASFYFNQTPKLLLFIMNKCMISKINLLSADFQGELFSNFFWNDSMDSFDSLLPSAIALDRSSRWDQHWRVYVSETTGECCLWVHPASPVEIGVIKSYDSMPNSVGTRPFGIWFGTYKRDFFYHLVITRLIVYNIALK